MCLGIPGEVIELHQEQPDLAKVDGSGVRRLVNIGLLSDDPPVPGEWVLIHVGFALSKIDEREAAAAMEFLEGIGQAYEDEIAALRESRIELQGERCACGSWMNFVTLRRPVPSPPRSRRCASRAGSTRSWRCAADIPTPSTSTALRTTCQSRSPWCTGLA